MTKPKLLVTWPTLYERAGDALSMYDAYLVATDAELDAIIAREGAGIDAIYCARGERLGAERLSRMPNLKLIAISAAGINGIDLDYAQAHGIAVTNAGAINAPDVADFALALFLGFRRELLVNDHYVRAGLWADNPFRPLGRSMKLERAGIVGFGHIGEELAARLKPMVEEIRWWGPNPKPDVPYHRAESLEALASWATTMFVTARGSDETVGLINAPILKALGKEGLLVNVARGFVVDEKALVAALQDGSLGGAALDVFEKEPIDGSPLQGMENVLLSPHVAGATVRAFTTIERQAWQNLRNLVEGKPFAGRVV